MRFSFVGCVAQECDELHLPRSRKSDQGLQNGAGIVACTGDPVQLPFGRKSSRIVECPVVANEVAADCRPGSNAAREPREGYAFWKEMMPRISSINSALAAVVFGCDMSRSRPARRSEHPFRVTCNRQAARLAGYVTQRQS